MIIPKMGDWIIKISSFSGSEPGKIIYIDSGNREAIGVFFDEDGDGMTAVDLLFEEIQEILSDPEQLMELEKEMAKLQGGKR
jgi:hypothetical protein